MDILDPKKDCPSRMHQCLCGNPRCIERRLVGDGILHCLDGSDEGEVDANFVCPESGETRISDESGAVPSTESDGTDDKSRNKRQTAPRRDQVVYPTGIISAFTGTEVNDGRTTLHRTELYRTYLDGSYSEVIQSTSSVLPTPTNVNRDQEETQTAYLGLANKAESFGSLSSGKVYLTAVSEPVSSLSSSILPVRHTNNIYGSSVSTSLENNEVISENSEDDFSPFSFTTITGSIIPYSGELITKHLILDVSARRVGTSYPEHSESSVISVTGTQGQFIHRDVSGDKTYSIFTGSYVSGSEDPTTYVFFFGNSPLTSEVRVVLPTKTSDTLLQTVHEDSAKQNDNQLKESTREESNNIETIFPGFRRLETGMDDVFLQLASVRRVDNGNKESQLPDVLSRRTRRDEDEVVNRLRNGDTYTSDDATPIYNNEQPFIANVLVSQESKPIAITRYIQPTSSREKSAYILISTSANEKATVGTARALSLRGHPKRSRHGRLYQPSPVAGRRVQGAGSATIITDQFFLPGETDIPYAQNGGINDEAFYEDDAIRVRGQDLNEEFRKFGGLGRFIIPSKSLFSDKRITKTVGLYGPIYDIDYDSNKDESAAYIKLNSTKENTAYHSKNQEENSDDTSGDKTITLFGFAEFSTKISGTNYIFMPASALPRTFTPRVTRTNFFRGTADSSTKASLQPEADVFFRQPLYGTETREFVSQMSMFTSTVKDPIELQKTMVTLTVATKQLEERSRIAKLGEDASVSETPSSSRPTTFSEESQADKHYSINIENLQKSNIFPENSMELDITEIVDDVPELKDHTPVQPTGLLSSITGTEVGDGMTTHWTTLIFGTYVDDTYAHIIQSTSSIFYTITKTATPEGILYETSEVGDSLYDNVEKSEFVDVHGSFYDTSMDNLSPSLNDISSSLSTVSFEPTEDLSATSAIQILTSGFFLPRGDNHHDISESFVTTEDLLNSGDNEEMRQTSDHEKDGETQSDLVSPNVLYGSHSYKENAIETPINGDPKHSTTVSLQILTEGFILPTFHKNTVHSSLGERNISKSSVNARGTSDSIESSETNSSLHTSKKNTEISLEDYINSRNGLSSEDRNEIHNDNHVVHENSVLSDSSNSLSLIVANIANSNSTGTIISDIVSEYVKEKISGTSNLEEILHTIESHNASVNPTVVHADDSDTQYSSPSVVLLTGDFILPRQSVNENENRKDEVHVLNSHLRPSILTDGFILPDGQEESPKPISENLNVTSSTTSSNILSTAPLSILTAGFIFPGKELKNKNTEIQNNLPSSELLTADFILPTRENTVEKDEDSSVAEARSAGSASSYIITDQFIFPTPASILLESNIADIVNKSEDGNSNGKINGNSIEAVANLGSQKRTESATPRLGKAIKLSKDATRVEELLPSISYPVTYYTTSTYFTTFLLEGSTVVSSREETVSQVYTDRDQLHEAQIASSEGQTEITQIKPSKSQDFYTDYTTVTYYKTFLQDGSVVVTSTEEIKPRTVHAAKTPSLPSKTTYPVSTYPTTYYTTLTYFTTLLRDGSTDIITSKTVMSNVVSTADDVRNIASTSHAARPGDDNTNAGSKPTTYYTTYTYYTTFLRDGETSVNTRLHTVSNVAYGIHQATLSTPTITTLANTATSTSPLENFKTKPTTYFTTYTYYTTYLRNDKTVISSREEVISNVIGAQTTTPSKIESTSIYSIKSSRPVKTTFYTTYTYYTTFLRDGTTTVSAREETVTNVKYDHSTVANDVKSTRTSSTSHVITPTPVVKTYFTTYTYFTTFLRNGSTVVSSRESTVENVVVETGHSSELPSSLSIAPTRIFSTYYTTLTSYFTLFKEGSPSVSTVFSTLTDVVALSTPDIRSSTEDLRTTVRLSPLTTTYTTVFTYYTTHFSNGAPIISSREETRSNVIILPTAKRTTDRLTTIVHAVTPLTSLHKKDSTATLFPANVVKTYYTTYSYFTTFLKDGQPSVSTRLETIKSFETPTQDLQLKLSTQVNKLADTTGERSAPSLFGSLGDVTSTLFSLVTHYTTYTYYTTQLKDGNRIVNSRTEVLSSVLPSLIEAKQTEKHIFSTTLLQDQYLVSISKLHAENNNATVNPIVAPVQNETKVKTDLDAAEGEFLEKRVQPNAVVTYFSTHTYLTTSIEANGHTQLLTRKVTASATITPEDAAKNEKTVISLLQQPHSAPVLSSSLIDCCNEDSKMQHKHTVYTTYTFYTTSYDGTIPVVNSRFEKVSNVIDQKAVEKTLLEIDSTETKETLDFTASEPQIVSYKTYEPSSLGKNSHYRQGPHVRLIEEESYNLHSVTPSDKLQKAEFLEKDSVNSSHDSEQVVFPESITNRINQDSEINKIRNDPNSQSQAALGNESISTELPQTNENVTSSLEKSLTDGKSLVTAVDSLASTDFVNTEIPKSTLDSGGHPLVTTDVTVITESVPNLTKPTSLSETTPSNTTNEETTTITTEDTKTLSEEILTTTTEVPKRRIFSRRNRPSYRPRLTTRVVSQSPTISSTTASPRTSAPFPKRNTSRLLFRRTNPANRTFPLRRLRISKPPEKANDSQTEKQKEAGARRRRRSYFNSHDNDYEAYPNLRKLLNARDEDAAIKNNDLVYPYSKHDHGGIVIRSAYEENSSSRDHRISPMQNSNDLYATGLIRSLEAKAVNNGVTTVYATEIHGTYINGTYAHSVHSSTKVLSDTSNEIDRTSLVMPSVPVQISSSTVNHQKVGLVSSDINTSVRDGKTTIYTTNIYGTYVGDVYAHIAQTFSSVVTPTASQPSQYSTGLISSTLRSETGDGSATVWTTYIYGTFVNGYYAHIASTISNVYGPQTKKTAQPTLLPSGFNNHIYAHATPDTDFTNSKHSANVQPQPRRIDQDRNHPKQEHKVGLLSSFVSDFVRDGTTTEYITNIYGTYVGQQYAQHMQTTSRILLPKHTETPTRSVGLLSTMLNSIVNENKATIYKTEIYGTYIGQHYAQIARTSTETRVLPSKTTKSGTPSTPIQKTGLITTSIIRSEVILGTTTLHLNEIYGTYIGSAYAHVAKSTSRVIQNTMETQNIPSSSQNKGDTSSQKTGLVSSKVSTEVNDGTTTLHISEIHGTYIGSYYAHIARRTSTVLPFITPSSTATLKTSQVEGIVSSIVSTEVNYGTTTLHTREIYGTTINGFYAHIARSTSNVVTPTPSSVQAKTAVSGLVSVITNSEINGGVITLYTTEIFGTTINGFYAHVARSSSIIISPTSSEQPVQTNAFISVTNSTEISDGLSTLHETSLIDSEVNGHYVQAVKSTSHVIYGSKPFEEHSTKASVQEVDVRQTLPVNGDRDFLDTARVNQVDSDNHHEHFSASKNRNLATPASLPSYYDILSPSFNSDNVLDIESSQTATPHIPLQLKTQSDSSYKELVSTLSYLPFLTESLTVPETVSKALKDKISSFQTSSASEDLTDDNNTTPVEDENEDYYNDYCEDEKSCKFKDTRTTKPNRGEPEEKRRASTRPPPKKLRNENDYDEYDYDQDYEEYEKKKEKEIGKHLPNVAPSRDRSTRTVNLRNSQQDFRKTTKTSFPDKDYDDYEDEYDDEQSSYQTSTESSESQSTKEQQTNSVRIRPFSSRGRPTFTTPVRATAKPSFTIQFRRPSRVRNSRAFGQRSDSENNHDFDDDLENEDEEGDIEASEAVVTSATPQVLPFRRKTFGSQRFQPLTRSSATSTSTTTARPPLILNRNRRLFGRAFSTSPSPTTSLKDSVSDYVENTTEDDEFDNYDDIEEKDEGNGNQRGLRLTRRPSSRFSRTYGDRRNPSIKRGTARQREDEEVENDDIDSTTPDYRSSRNHRYQRKQNRNRWNQNRSPSLKTSFNSVNRDEDEDPHSLQPINRLRNNSRRRQSYNPRTRRPTKTATETQTTVKKPHLTVTSVVTTVKTLPIYHGFRTSYATLTTTALDTSIINPSQYSTVVTDGLTKTLVFSKVGLPDGLENFYTTITEVVITTTSLASVKLVPIKIGFSTRTDTVTDIQVLTTLSTVYSTISPDTPTPTAFPQQFQPPPFFPQIAPQNQDFGLFNSPNSFVTTQVVTSTTVIPVVLRGRTILSTLTTTSTSESTVVQTANIRVPQVPSAAPFIPQPYFAFQPITTQITLYVTGEYGELKPVVTTVTVPLYQQPVFHTKVARSLQSAPTEQPIISTELPKLVLKTSMNDNVPRYLEIDTHYDKLLSSGLEEINDISEITNSRAKTDPLGSTALPSDSNNYNSADVTTILKGPLTEIYEQKATVNIDLHSVHNEIEHPASRASEKFGIESSYNFRKLQQFLEDDEEDVRLQHDFTRLRRPPPEITRSSVVSSFQAGSRSPETLFSRRQPQINSPRRQPSVEVFTERTTGEEDPAKRKPPRGTSNESPTISRRLQRPPGNYRPFVRRPSSLLRDETDVRNLPSIEAQPAQPGLNDLDQINGLIDISRVPSRESAPSNTFSGSPSLDEASHNGFRPLVSPPPSGNLNGDGPQTNLQVRPVRLRIVRPSYDSVSSKNTLVKRITKTRMINPTHATSFAVAENELETNVNLKDQDNTNSTKHRSQDSDILPTLTEEVSLSSTSIVENSVTKNSYEDESSLNPKENNSDYAALRRTVVRRLRPSFIPGDGRGARRPVVVRRTRFSTLEISESNSEVGDETSTLGDSPSLSEVSETLSLFSNDREAFENEKENEYLDTTSPSFDTKPLRKVIRLRRPESVSLGQNYQRRRIIVTKRPSDKTESTGHVAGPLLISNTLDDRHKYDFLSDGDVPSANKVHYTEDSDHVSSTNLKDVTKEQHGIYSTKPFPFTYYTTLTYFTTFVRGTDVIYASREAVFSNIIHQTLNPSLISVIQNRNGYLSNSNEDQTVHLASRILGDTTTLVNLASKQNVYNSDIYKFLKGNDKLETTSTSTPGEHPSGSAFNSINLLTTNIGAVASLPKTYVTLFTYFYTFYDGNDRRHSTRAETITNVAVDPTQFLSQSIGTSIDEFGYLPIGPSTNVVNLGSRNVEGTTTEVNLGLKTLVHFSGLRNIILETDRFSVYITPSRPTALPKTESSIVRETLLPSFETSREGILTSSLLQPSYVSANELFNSDATLDGVSATPIIPYNLDISDNNEVEKSREPFLRVTSVIHKPSGSLRSGVFTPRPGLRVRVRPVVSRRPEGNTLSDYLAPDYTDGVITTASEKVASDTKKLDFYNTILPIPVADTSYIATAVDTDDTTNLQDVGKENEVTSEEEVAGEDDEAASHLGGPTRKRLKITVRRPQSGSVSRTHTRFVLPSRFEITSKPRFYVVTRTGALGVVSPSQRPFTVKISRKVKSSAADDGDVIESTTVVYDTYTTLTTVPVIFGLETSFRNVLLTTSSPVTVTHVSPSYEEETPGIQPSHTVVLTYFTTTTFTIPYTIGHQTLYTTLEETNSRIVTTAFDGLDSLTYSTITRTTTATEEISVKPSRVEIEFGFGGPTTHILSSDPDGTRTMSVIYPPGQEGERATKVVVTNPDGIELTSLYGQVSPEKEEMSIITVGTLDDLSPDSSRSSVEPVSSFDESTIVLYDTQTFFTTYTVFTTFFTGTDSFISSYEQVVSNVITVPVTRSIIPTSSPHIVPELASVPSIITVFDTSELVTTTTSYNTVTFYATLFNDTMSFVTPIEEVQTETGVITETYTITKTILPTPVTESTVFLDTSSSESESSVIITQTLYTTYTNYVTLFQGTDTVVSNLEEVVSNIVTLTLPASEASTLTLTSETQLPTILESPEVISTSQVPIYTTREVLSTQTHYLTIFNGDEKILSSLEEVVTSFVTEIASPHVPSDTPELFINTSSETSKVVSTELFSPFTTQIFSFEPTMITTTEEVEETETYQPELVPSIRTIYSTLTFYTTYFSDTSSIVATQEEVLTSYVTLFVPPSLITSTSTEEQTSTSTPEISSTTTTDQVFIFTTTDYSTLTLYTTLFSGDDTTVISSEQIIPEIITATITPSSASTLESTPSAESVLTFLTTFTYYTTYFSGADAVIASSESVVTQFVTIEAAPTFTSTASSTELNTPVVPDETILGVSVVSGGDISSSFKDDIREEKIIGVVTAVSSSVATEREKPLIAETSVVSIVSSATRVEVGSETRPDFDISSTVVEETFSETSLASEEHNLPDSVVGRSHEGRGISTHDTLLESTLLSETLSEDSPVVLFTDVLSSKTPDLPFTSSSVVTETTEIIGVDGKITTLVPSATLMLVTGIDGFVTKLSETEVSVSSLSSISATVNSTQSSSEIKPATVIELTDLLGGNTAFGGDIGLAIQDIVSLITGKKNKTEGENVLSETTTQDTTTTNVDETKKNDTETLDSTTDSTSTTESSTPTSIEKGTTKEEKDEIPDLGAKDSDYPIFIPDTPKSFIPSDLTDIPTPVYIPSPKIEASEVEINSTDASSTEIKVKTLDVAVNKSDDITRDTMTSVITGIRTVFLKTSPTATSSEEELSISLSTSDPSDGLKSDTVSSKTESGTLLETTSVLKELTHSATPKLSTSVETSIVTGVKTIFFETVSSPPDEKTEAITSVKAVGRPVEDSVLHAVTKLQSSSKSAHTTDLLPRGRANDEPSVLRSFTTVTKDGQTIVSRTTSGATTIFYPANLPKASFSTLTTRFITSVESITRTLALTTTRTYYTRDSTLTVPSVYTTTIPPRTFVSTLIGTRTILGILPEPAETIQIHQTSAPTERTTTVTTTTLIFNSIPSTVVRTLVLPTRTILASTSSFSESTSEESVFNAGTEKPAKPPEVADSTSVVHSGSYGNDSSSFKTPFQKQRDETYLRAAGPRLRDYQLDIRNENEIVRPPIVITEASTPEHPFIGKSGICEPSCQPHKKEVCQETHEGYWTCQCRPGHARKENYDVCSEVQTYVVLLKVLKMGNTTINFSNNLADNRSEKFREFTKAAKEGISEMYQYTSIRDHYLSSDVNGIIPADKDASENVSPGEFKHSGVIVNFTVQVSPSVSKTLLEQELTRSLQLADQRVGVSLLTMEPLSQSVRDFDECQDLRYNDCSLNAHCHNTPGSYTCECMEGFEDMDSKLPGRTCLAKIENCEYCHSRGDCLEKEEGKIFCRCLPMFIGRRCEINGLVLAIALPTSVAVVVMLLCGVAFCCRRCRRKSAKNDSSGMFREIALRGPVGSTLDRKAMIDTSSESSGEHGIRNPQAFDGYQESGDVTPKKGSKKSDLSLDRSLSTGYTVPPVMIPRARQHQPHNKMNYAVYNGQVYVW